MSLRNQTDGLWRGRDMRMGEEGLTGTGNGLAILQETTSTLVVISGEHSCLCV